jgi:hypothetical protein
MAARRPFAVPHLLQPLALVSSALVVAALAVLLASMVLVPGCARTEPKATAPTKVPGKVTISYDLNHISKIASNQLAVWIEDSKGNYVRTVFATRFMARGGYKERPQCCPTWIKISGWKDASAQEIDGVTGATQRAGRVAVVWDCTDKNGRPVPRGTYVYRVEGNLFWENRVMAKGEIPVEDKSTTSKAALEYIPKEARDAGELFLNVTAEFRPE